MIWSDDGSQQHFQGEPKAQKVLWTVQTITEKKEGMYKVRWNGINPETGEEWPQEWISHRDCPEALVDDWT